MLLDTASLYFRAFYGVPDTRRSADAPPTNAASGLMDMLARLIREHRPGALVACWDADWRPQWRVDLIPSYKEHRVATGDEEEMPDALAEQIPLIEALLVGLGVPPVGVPDHEADDVIGTYATIAQGAVDVVTGDRDLFQLVDDDRGVRVLYTARGISKIQFVDAAFVQEKYGVTPSQYADMATLRGDTSDGLPGVAGIGDKTAASLLRLFGDLDGVLMAAADPASSIAPRIRTSLQASAQYLAVAPTVVRVARDLPVPAAPEGLPVPDLQLLEAIGTEFGIGNSVKRLLSALADQTSEE
jgi:5'-3' exonuclease